MDMPCLAQRRFPGSFIFLLFPILFLACHASVLVADYGFSDDYTALFQGPSGWHVKKVVLEGRPLLALWSKLIHYPVTGVDDFRYVRRLRRGEPRSVTTRAPHGRPGTAMRS